MIYLLYGILIIHGIVCLLGAFFPFYPPIYFFYVFFPGHFAIRLIIVLIIGAAQLAYGVHLVLRKRWKIRWYWPAIATVVITGLLLIYPAVQSPGLFGVSAGKDEIRQPIPIKEMHPSLAGPEAPDDIIPTPGGPGYRVGQQGVEHPWPPIDTIKVTLGSSFETDTVYIRYRDYIETEAGESRNNIVFISMGNRAVGSLNLSTVNLPAGIEVTEGMRWHGPGPVSVVLVMEIAPDVQPGQYNFGIGIEIDGKDYGTIPCTIKVLETVSAGTPSEPKEPYPGNHGITSTRATPEPGDNIYRSSSLMIRLTMDDLIERSDVVVIGKVVDIFPARRVDINGSSRDWIITTDAVIEVERYLYGQSRSPYIAVMVQGGRVEQTFVWVEDQPEFNLGEEVALFLNHPQLEITPPQGFEVADYYMVTGSMQGKFSYKDGYMVNLEGESFTVSEIERKIDLVHGGK